MENRTQPHTWDYGKTGARKLGKIWQLERLVNYGAKTGKINGNELKDNLIKLKIDPAKKDYLQRLLKK